MSENILEQIKQKLEQRGLDSLSKEAVRKYIHEISVDSVPSFRDAVDQALKKKKGEAFELPNFILPDPPLEVKLMYMQNENVKIYVEKLFNKLCDLWKYIFEVVSSTLICDENLLGVLPPIYLRYKRDRRLQDGVLYDDNFTSDSITKECLKRLKLENLDYNKRIFILGHIYDRFKSRFAYYGMIEQKGFEMDSEVNITNEDRYNLVNEILDDRMTQSIIDQVQDDVVDTNMDISGILGLASSFSIPVEKQNELLAINREMKQIVDNNGERLDTIFEEIIEYLKTYDARNVRYMEDAFEDLRYWQDSSYWYYKILRRRRSKNQNQVFKSYRSSKEEKDRKSTYDSNELDPDIPGSMAGHIFGVREYFRKEMKQLLEHSVRDVRDFVERSRSFDDHRIKRRRLNLRF